MKQNNSNTHLRSHHHLKSTTTSRANLPTYSTAPTNLLTLNRGTTAHSHAPEVTRDISRMLNNTPNEGSMRDNYSRVTSRAQQYRQIAR